MPSPIKYYKKDPSGKGRGEGIYYLRAGDYFSKYSMLRDKRKKSKGWKIHLVGLPKGTTIPHTSDGKLPR